MIILETLKRGQFESHIGRNKTWWIHYNHYRNSAFLLANSVNNGTPIDIISLPLLFLLRHSIELGLKANICEFEELKSNNKKIKITHNLESLFKTFKIELDNIITENTISKDILDQIESYNRSLENLINQIHFLDKGSYSFRYPVDKDGNNCFEWTDRIDIREFLDLLNQVNDFVLFTTGVLEECGVEFKKRG